MATKAEQHAMARALALAAVPGWRDPNPRVGAIVLDADSREVAASWHRGSGTAHAEDAALRLAAEAARGSTVVVTLEPCNAETATPACARLLVDAGVRRVVYAVDDPNPCACGGADRLRAAGLDVESGVLAAEAERLNEYWLFAMRRDRPYVTWKLATTLHGRSAAADGSSRWITGVDARRDVHRLRGTADTILVGTGTVLRDDPWLVLRDESEDPLSRGRQPRRAVMGLTPIPAAARVLDAAAETVMLETREPEQGLKELRRLGSQHVWLEGGPRLAAGFLHAGLVDRCIACVAPAFLGAGVAAVAGLGIETVDQIERFRLTDAERVGDDVRLTMERPG